MKRFSVFAIVFILCLSFAGCIRTTPLRTIPAISPENDSKKNTHFREQLCELLADR